MNMKQICAQFKISKQAHYQKTHREKQEQKEQKQVVALVKNIRSNHPKMGTRKLLTKIKPDLGQLDVKMGRDKLFELLRGKDMLIYPRKTYKSTTQPGSFRTPNLLSGKTISHPNQVWVADITYVDVEIGETV